MDSRYIGWIASYTERNKNFPTLRGLCASATIEMKEAFPELERVRGFVVSQGGELCCEDSGDVCWSLVEQHWWLQTSSGEVVDPTSIQYDSIGLIDREYIPYDLMKHGPEPTGKCMNCGWLCMAPRSGACSDECEKALEEYYNIGAT